MYNKPSKANNRLPLLAQAPTTADLQNLMQLAQSYLGEPVEVSWNSESISFTLQATLPAPNPKNARRAPAPSDTEWTLLSRMALSPRQEQAWRHKSADIEFIGNLIAVLPGSTPTGTTTEFTVRPTIPAFANAAANASSPQQGATQAASAPQPQTDPGATDSTGGGMKLSGNLSEVEINGILQSIALLRMTGCLEVHAQLDEVFLYFDDGALVHALYESTLGSAESLRVTGDRVLLELLLWNEGQFNFRPGKKDPERTVTRRLEGLLMEGATLQDYWRHLLKSGMHYDGVVTRTRNNLGKEEFDRLVKAGLPLDLAQQQRVYLEINGQRTVQDVVSKFGFPRLIWIPIMFNLHNAKLIAFSALKEVKSANSKSAPPIPDNLTLNKARSSLTRIESGIMSYELFFHFLQLEFERFKKNQSHNFSVIVFSIHGAATKEPLSVLAVSKLTEFIDQVKDKLDIVAHYRQNDFIILSPHRSNEQSYAFVEQIVKSLGECTIERLQASDLNLAFGIASVPQNCRELSQLLSMAEAAKDGAIAQGQQIAMSQAKA